MQAPPAEITINGDDYEDWETTGCDPRAEIGQHYTIHLDEDGVAEWEQVEDEVPDTYGDEFAIQGTFNDWDPNTIMARHPSIPGLWIGSITVGRTGEEEFQIIADGDPELVYSPSTVRCRAKAAPINGPGRAERELSWLVRGDPGDTLKVEFFQQDEAKSIIWMKSAIEC